MIHKQLCPFQLNHINPLEYISELGLLFKLLSSCELAMTKYGSGELHWNENRDIFIYFLFFLVRSRSSKQKSGQECRIDCRPQGDSAVLQAQE
jgi:hypothetical protein